MAVRRMVLCLILMFLPWGNTGRLPPDFIESFQATILTVLNLERPPKFNGTVHVPEALREMYDQSVLMKNASTSLHFPGIHGGSVNTVRTFAHVESSVDDAFITPQMFRLSFNVSLVPNSDIFRGADIKITRESLPAVSHRYRVLVRDIVKRGVKGVRSAILRVIDSKIVDPLQNDTLSINVTPAAQRWITDPKSNHGILISLHRIPKNNKKENETAKKKKDTKDNKNVPHLRLKRDTDEHDEWVKKQPLLYVYSDSNKQTNQQPAIINWRYKRGAKKGKKTRPASCHRQDMMVFFEDLGWNDWIVSPPHYNAYVCDGLCEFPMAAHLNATNHAVIQGLVNSFDPTLVPQPCCAPKTYSSISLLYRDPGGNVVLKNYREMVVENCQCK